MASDLLIRVKFAGVDGLSKMLDTISGSSRRAAREIDETNKSLRAQKKELRDVERQLTGAMQAAAPGLTELVEKQGALKNSIAGSNRQLEKQRALLKIDGVTARAHDVGRNLVSSGQSELFSAALLASPFIAIAKASAEFEALQNRMRVLGLGDGATKELTAFAKAMDVAGSSVNDNMRFLLEAQGVFRESGAHSIAEQLSGAKLMAPILAKMKAVYAATGKELSEDQERYFLRFIEQAGGLQSPKRAAELADGLFRALQSSGGNVQAENYQGFLAKAGIAGTHLSNRSMFADLEPIIGELHQSAGVGLATAFKMATGIKVNSNAANEFVKLGLWDRDKVVFNKLGGVKKTTGNPLKAEAAAALQHDPVEFYRKFVMPAYDKAGIKTPEGRAFENAKIFGGTGGNVYNLIDKQMPTILRSRTAYEKTQGLDKAYAQTNDSFFGKEGKLRAAGKNFMVVAGTKGGLLDTMTSLLEKATSALKAFTAFGEAHPTAFSWIGKIVADLLLLKVGLAVAKIAFGGLLGPAARVVGMWSKIRAAGSIAEAYPAVAKAGGLAKRAGGAIAGRGSKLIAAGGKALRVVSDGAAIADAAKLAKRAGGFIGGKGRKLAAAGKEAFEFISSGGASLAVSGFNKIKGAAIAMGSGLARGAVGGWQLVRMYGALAASAVGDAIVASFEAIGTAVVFLGRSMMRAGMMMLANPMVLAIVAIGVAIGVVAYLVYKNWDKIKAALTDGWNWLKGLGQKFKNLGAMMLDGLLSMLDPSRLTKHLIDMGKAAVNAFKGILGIHSPSRVFADVGMNLMLGLVDGLEAHGHKPLARLTALAGQMKRAMATDALAASVVASVAIGAGVASPAAAARPDAARAPQLVTHAPVYHLHFHQQPGQSAQDLARVVAAELDRRDRSRAAARRSQFADYGD